MGHNTEIEDKSAQIKFELIDICNKAIQLSSTVEFPKCGPELEYALKNINNETFDVVVCGEVKKGKSSFINAIIGDDILPVDTRVATSQAFRVINSEEYAYYLVYTDGSKQEVGREELATYGSQVKIDKAGEPITFGKIVDYMEVHIPIPFLPKSVVLVDTPGLGAIYANHATVTKRHLAKASAVIFIMDPSNPLTDAELSFLDEITGITPNVLFVMTKQDNFESDYIDTQINRNIEILAEKGFKEKLTNNAIKILPMSSTMLYDVSNADIEKDEKDIFYEISSFENVKKELLIMLQLTISLSKSIAAYNAVNEYNSRVMTAVSEGETILTSPDKSKQLLVKKQSLKAQFQSTWGPNGCKQKEIVAKVNETISSYATKAVAMFNPGTDLYNKLLSEIEGLSNYDETKSYAELFPKRMMTEYMQAWRGLNEDCNKRISDIMSQFKNGIDDDRNRNIGSDLASVATLPSYQLPQYGLLDHFNFTKSGWFTLLFATSVLNIGLSIVALPIAALIGWFTGNKAKVNQMKNDLKAYLNRNLSSLHSQVLTNPMNPNDTLAKSLFETTKEKHLQTAQEMLKQIYEDQLSIYDDEVTRLNNQVTELNSQRTIITEKIKFIKNNWNPIYLQLKELRENLESMEKQILKK